MICIPSVTFNVFFLSLLNLLEERSLFCLLLFSLGKNLPEAKGEPSSTFFGIKCNLTRIFYTLFYYWGDDLGLRFVLIFLDNIIVFLLFGRGV